MRIPPNPLRPHTGRSGGQPPIRSWRTLLGIVLALGAGYADGAWGDGVDAGSTASVEHPSRRADASGLLRASAGDGELVLERLGRQVRLSAEAVSAGSTLLAFALEVGGAEDSVVVHGPAGVVLARHDGADARQLWGRVSASHDVDDMAIAGPWRHAHWFVDADGDGWRDLLTRSVRHMDVGTERKLSAHRWTGAAIVAVDTSPAHASHRTKRRANARSSRQAVTRRLLDDSAAASRVRFTARADIAARRVVIADPGSQGGFDPRRTDVRVGVRTAFLVRVENAGDARRATAHLAIVRNVPADGPEVLATRELGRIDHARAGGECVDGFAQDESLRATAWDAGSRALVASFHPGAGSRSAWVLRWDGATLGPMRGPFDLGSCAGPTHRLQIRPGGKGEEPLLRLKTVQPPG